jgi:RNA polymerase sigma-70 factor (TIGR02943 family)
MPISGTITPSKWVESYADSLFNYAILRVNDREAARDLVQETFLSALQNVSTFKGESTEKTWLFAILKNKIIDRYRKSAAGKEVPTAGEPEGFDLEDFFERDGEWQKEARPLDWSDTPHDDYRSREFLGVLQKCLARLKDDWRTLFTLKYIDELDSEEICKELGLTSSNYWVIMHRAKLVLRQCVEKNWLKA